MPQCPQCNKPFAKLPRECPTCRADLGLLVDYVDNLQVNLNRADHLTRSGELGQAVWAYLSVLEVDPDNAIAQQQVSQVATAVRQFDRTAPGRRWIGGLRGELTDDGRKGAWWSWLLGIVLVVILFAGGVLLGYSLRLQPDDTTTSPPPPDLGPQTDTLGPPPK